MLLRHLLGKTWGPSRHLVVASQLFLHLQTQRQRFLLAADDRLTWRHQQGLLYHCQFWQVEKGTQTS